MATSKTLLSLVALVWIPAQLQINAKYMDVNSMVALLLPNIPSVNLNSNDLVVIFDRLEKSLYLVTDAALNYYFIYVVQRRLVASGLKKYDRLVSFNKMIIWCVSIFCLSRFLTEAALLIRVSLAMDVMIIGSSFLLCTGGCAEIAVHSNDVPEERVLIYDLPSTCLYGQSWYMTLPDMYRTNIVSRSSRSR